MMLIFISFHFISTLVMMISALFFGKDLDKGKTGVSPDNEERLRVYFFWFVGTFVLSVTVVSVAYGKMDDFFPGYTVEAGLSPKVLLFDTVVVLVVVLILGIHMAK
jgi:hypothetical protein